jgi:hypothetical protein
MISDFGGNHPPASRLGASQAFVRQILFVVQKHNLLIARAIRIYMTVDYSAP